MTYQRWKKLLGTRATIGFPPAKFAETYNAKIILIRCPS